MARQFTAAIVALDFRKVLDPDLKIVRHIACRNVLTIEIFDDKAGKEWPSAR